MLINGKWVPMGIYFDADGGGSGGGGGGDDDLPDPPTTDDDIDDDNNDLTLEELKKEHKKELDRYRNEVGKLKKQLKTAEEKGMSEEEKLEAQRKDLEKKEKQLKVKELIAYKAQKVAEMELDKRLAEGIKVEQLHLSNPELSEADIDTAIQELKTVQDAMKEEVINELQENGTVLNGFGGEKDKNSGKDLLGKKLAEFDNKNNKGAIDAQDHYFGKGE
ncbi:MAG: hypothetical protein MI740_10455 [Halanaerobiales bacterium]|nr:hypothetical protein [Halanaerobiales bacterium]